MADFNLYFPKLLELEGGYTNDKEDKGGATKFGITLEDWKQYGYDINSDGIIDEEDVKLITIEDAHILFEKKYWLRMKCDEINNQSVAEIFCDWGVNSGVTTSVKKIQAIVGTQVDGKIGPKTLAAINKDFSKDLFDSIKNSRKDYFLAIVNNNPSQKKFLKGWFNRINSFIYNVSK